MSKCEDTIIEKEKDVCHLKCSLHELKTHFNEKDEEVDALKVKNRNIENEMKLLKDQLLENRVDLLG